MAARIAAVPAAGAVDVDVLAVSTGSATRLKKGEILEYLSTPAGIQTKIELQRDLDDDGFDSEQDGAARNRLLAALATPSSGGNQSDFVGWALSQLGISQAFCYPNRAGLGTVDVAALHTGADRPLPGAVAASSSISTAQLQVLATGIGTSNPAGVYGAWVGALLRGTLQRIVTYTRGVRSTAVIAPAADQEAVDYAFPLDTQIGLLTPGYVLVRRG